ncbi:uncharacterized protein MONBRDRAFT_26830 [Monosiga brevicollis MX1]|uniref:Peptidase S54 rhomboid domain-containing protein n=1 Tax=Monosiga brevicollis TaxID=81824 RepID=A9V3N0_MONBE|nr:uncharacterized protein MONBRDRAFT_26830 [Monosiga brevicollis MX1]EDQ87731.1 predicted protein [Monosiga brevicollis MX1]|eukprot:XP_001747264.1 hypothetical protein [Monosiga brevicollis MX1]
MPSTSRVVALAQGRLLMEAQQHHKDGSAAVAAAAGAGGGAAGVRWRAGAPQESNGSARIPPITPRTRHRANRVKAAIDERIDRLARRQPFINYYLMAVQVVVHIITLIVVPQAPIASRPVLETAAIDDPAGNSHVLHVNKSGNVLIGPSAQDLIAFGAVFAPCMRRDPRVDAYVQAQRLESDNLGCCVHTFDSQGFTGTADECTGLAVFFNETICYGRRCCVDPTVWPECVPLLAADLPNDTAFEPCRVDLVANPCCTGIFGECSIMTRDECAFRDGYYHADKRTCAEVDCLQSVCGLFDFVNPFIPDQWYRLITTLVLPPGTIYLLAVLVGQLYISVPIEQSIGWKRFGVLALSSGVGGYIISGIFVPYEIKSGISPVLYGCLGALYIELFQSWKRVLRPARYLLWLVLITALAFAVGTLKYIDNFGHVGGFVFGVVTALIVLPWETFSNWDKVRKRLIAIVAAGVLALMFITSATMLFTGEAPDCEACYAFNCIDWVPGMCDDDARAVI